MTNEITLADIIQTIIIMMTGFLIIIISGDKSNHVPHPFIFATLGLIISTISAGLFIRKYFKQYKTFTGETKK